MQEYKVKKSSIDGLSNRISVEMANIFEIEPEKKGDAYIIKYGALKRLEVKIGPKGNTIIIDSESDPSVEDEVILDTNRRFRRYLDAVTGYTTKERVKQAKKE